MNRNQSAADQMAAMARDAFDTTHIHSTGAAPTGATGFKPFVFERETTVGGQPLKLRLDFRAICTIEETTSLDIESAVAVMRSAKPPMRVMGLMLYAVTRGHHPEMTLNQAAGLMAALDASNVGFALASLFEEPFPFPAAPAPKAKRPARAKAKAKAGK